MRFCKILHTLLLSRPSQVSSAILPECPAHPFFLGVRTLLLWVAKWPGGIFMPPVDEPIVGDAFSVPKLTSDHTSCIFCSRFVSAFDVPHWIANQVDVSWL